jgi:hypothetical protein
MVRLQTLDLRIGVRVPASQPPSLEHVGPALRQLRGQPQSQSHSLTAEHLHSLNDRILRQTYRHLAGLTPDRPAQAAFPQAKLTASG